MKQITRKTEVVSISLPKSITAKLDQTRKKRSQSRSSFIANLIKKESEEESWKNIYKWGRETARKFKINSEEDIDRILHETS